MNERDIQLTAPNGTLRLSSRLARTVAEACLRGGEGVTWEPGARLSATDCKRLSKALTEGWEARPVGYPAQFVTGKVRPHINPDDQYTLDLLQDLLRCPGKGGVTVSLVPVGL